MNELRTKDVAHLVRNRVEVTTNDAWSDSHDKID
jgi:hypothetical protein